MISDILGPGSTDGLPLPNYSTTILLISEVRFPYVSPRYCDPPLRPRQLTNFSETINYEKQTTSMSALASGSFGCVYCGGWKRLQGPVSFYYLQDRPERTIVTI